jgi:hypothetical protein
MWPSITASLYVYNQRENEQRDLMSSIPEGSKNVVLETSAERSLNTYMSTQQNKGKIKIIRRLISPSKI